jgi:hypothetical protein
MQATSSDSAQRRPLASEFAGALARITLLACLVFLSLGPIAFYVDQGAGLAALAIAVIACHLGIVAAMVYHEAARDPRVQSFHVLAAMGFRLGLPLAVCVIAAVSQSWVMDAGFVYWILAAYPALLAGQVWLEVRRAAGSSRSPQAGA